MSSLTTGDWVSLCVRTVFFADIACPIFGLTVKTPDGVEISGNNSRDAAFFTEFTPRRAGEEVIVRFDFHCVLNGGDYLLSVGIAEETNTGVIPLDRRYDSIHITVLNARRAFGLVDLGIKITEMADGEPRHVGEDAEQAVGAS